MRRLIILSPVCLAAACNSEPNFDERYERAQEQIENKANELDNELQATRDAGDQDAPISSTDRQ